MVSRFSRVLQFCVVLGLVQSQHAGVDLKLQKTTALRKRSGGVQQVVPLANGGFAVRDADFRSQDRQALELFGRDGNLVASLGGFGRIPGKYVFLKQIAVDRSGLIWAADIVGRLTRYSSDGTVQQTMLVQNPGYRVHSVVLDEPRGFFYLTGCVPQRTYLDLGCKLIHQYKLRDSKYQQSFLETDPDAIAKHLLPIEDYLVDIDSRGVLYAVDAPIFKLFRIDARNGRQSTFPIRSGVAKPVGILPVAKPPAFYNELYEQSFLIDRVLAVNAYVVVSIRKPHSGGFLLQVFSEDGRQLATDIDSPGRLVGKTSANTLLFTQRSSQQFELREYELLVKARD
ncbi:MAG: hypothetical protein L0338_10220 [Acidobacteria bacterium]|nr:hypothetical protein [Acidobacteriota bacterium]